MRHRIVQLASILLLVSACRTEPAEPKVKPLPIVPWSGEKVAGWEEFDRFEDEQKYEEASKQVTKMLEEARAAGNTEEVVRCLIKWTQLRMALHGWETSVRFLKDQEWPQDLLSQAVLNLYYGSVLVQYAHGYSWEINQRERIDTKGEVDLKAWTMEQIYAEAQRAYEIVWQHRDQIGQFSKDELDEYITANTYPDDIRPTLRDAVSYLRVQLLADTQGWRPEHSNELFRLPLPALVGRERIERPELTDPEVHPLFKIAFILDDLEHWHASNNRVGAALEARLERLRLLHGSFTEPDDAELIRKTLAGRLPPARQHSWWAEGQATLAELVQAEDAPDNLVRARAIAEEGRLAYPESIGGEHCRSIVESIDMPDYSLRAMSHDSPDRRSVALSYRNLTNIYFRAYARNLRKLIDSKRDEVFPDAEALERLLTKKPDHAWSVQLPATTDFKHHQKLVTPPMTKPGYYVVVASAREDFAQESNVRRGVHTIVSDLVLVTHEWGPTATATVLSAETGEPVPGVRVTLYKYDWRERRKPVSTKNTNARGEVRLTGSSEAYGYFLLAEKGAELAVDLDALGFYRGYQPRPETAVLVYTDRSIYRPMQKVHWKIVVYRGRHDQGRFKVQPKKRIRVYLRDANYQQVATKTVVTNKYGTASGEFDIPAGRLLGHWSIGTSHDGHATVRVEEYKRPTFETKLLEGKEPMRLNRPVTLKGEARYYFGLPVATGDVKWRIQRVPVYPWWWGYYRWYGGGHGASTQTVATGTSKLGADGTYEILFTPEADERKGKDVSYRYTVTADVTDEGGETRTATRSFRLGFVAVEGNVVVEGGFFRAGEPALLTINRTNLDGAPAPGEGNYSLVAVKQPDEVPLPADIPRPLPPGARDDGALRLPDDLLRPRFEHGYDPAATMREWPDGDEKKKGELKHDDKGVATVELGTLAAGVYRIHYETRDAFGETFTTSKELVVCAERTELALPGILLAEKSSVPVGGTARFLVTSGLADQPIFFEVYRNEKRVEQRRLRSDAKTNLIEIPVTEADRGGFGVTLWLERDHQMVGASRSIHVPWDNKELEVELATFRDKLRPGQEETWTVKVTGPAGKETAVAGAELLAYMYDRSLDFFAPHSPPSPLSLYPYRGGAALPRSNLEMAPTAWLYSDGFPSPAGWSSPSSDSLQFYSGYGIGGPGYRNRFAMPMTSKSTRGAPKPKRAEKRKKRNGGDNGDSEADEAEPMEEPSAARDLISDPNKVPQPDDKSKPETKEEPPAEVRTDFSETAFWQPHLTTGRDGSVSFTFKVPDSVTSWNLWVHALTRDLAAGSVTKQTRTVKDLMVRPYLPRFLREGDTADLKVVLNNASEQELSGEVTFDIQDPVTEESVLDRFGLAAESAKASFTAPKGGSANVTFPIETPPELGLVAFKIVARSGSLSDGELRPLPLLPGRMHLAQSRFVTLRKEKKREMTFADMAKDDDPSMIHEQLVVTVDAQLFYAVLQSLPYLVNYPYECTEQTLNRFVSTGIVTSLYDKYPAISTMARKMSERKTRFERWDQPDPNRRMALEEAPWLRLAQGGSDAPDDLINVLNPSIAAAHRKAALDKLRKAQTSSGGFPWFPGGPPSPWITLYLLYGFSKALEFGVDVPQDMIVRAWSYLHQHYVDRWVRECMAHDSCWESITFLNYTLSNYPDTSWTGGVFTEAERKEMLAFSFEHWKEHTPYLKGYLALTLARMQRKKDAELVWASVMDSAKTEQDQGTFWAPEDRSWLWYSDTIETHAFAIRTLMELDQKNDKLDGLILWIFLNKKMNHWKSTRATAEVVYSLAKYLDVTGELGAREEAKITIGDDVHSMVFEPDEYTGKKNQIVVPGDEIEPKKTSTIVVEKPTRGFLLASATWHFSTERMPDEARGDYLAVTRKFYRRDTSGREATLKPLKDGAEIAIGDEIEVQLSLTSKHPMEYVHLRDPRGAGFEPVSNVSQHKWDLGIYWYEEIRDSGTNFFFEHLPQGEYTFKYRLRAAVAGTFKVAPAVLQPLYAPEFVAYSSGTVIAID